MRKFLITLISLALVLTLALSMSVSATLSDFTPVEKDGEYFKFMTFNLRYDTTSHPLISEKIRGAHLLELIDGYAPDSIGLQETTNAWMSYLRTEMGKKNYAYVGLGRDNGLDDTGLYDSGNEFSPVFYRSDKYDLIDSDTIWLARTPDVPTTQDWGAACRRVCSYAVLKNKTTGQAYAHFNTHLDHVSELAKENGVKVIMARIQKITEKHGDIPVVFTGDFNSVSRDENADYGKPYPYRVVTSMMDDSAYLAEELIINGSTMSGYQNPDNWDGTNDNISDVPSVDFRGQAIDYIFLTKNRFEVKTYTVVNDVFDFEYNGKQYDDHAVSDHWGVYCEAKLKDEAVAMVDESELIGPAGKLYTGGRDIPRQQTRAKLAGLTALEKTASFSSNLDCSAAVANLSAGNAATLDAKYTGKLFWEITAALSNISSVSGVRFTLGENVDPASIEVMGSADGQNFHRMSGAFTEITGEDAYVVLTAPQEYSHIKLVLTEVQATDSVADLSIYGVPVADLVKRSGGESFVPVSGPSHPADKAHESYEKAFDGSNDTKFYTREENYNNDLVWRSRTDIKAVAYSFTVASDAAQFPLRQPHAWTLYGSNDNKTWSVIDERTNDQSIPNVPHTEVKFDIDRPMSYSYYKLAFRFDSTEYDGDHRRVQVAEVALYEKTGGQVIDPETLNAVAYAEVEDANIHLTVGEELTAEMLPSSAFALLESGCESQVAVVWDLDGFDPEQVGTQQITGVLETGGILNPQNITVTATVEVQAASVPGDVDNSGTVDVADIMKLKALIMADKWSDEELRIGDMDSSNALDVGDIMAVKNIIMSK